MDRNDIIKSSLTIYEEKLKKIVEKRDSEINRQVKELKDHLLDTLYVDEIKGLQDIIANFYILLGEKKPEIKEEVAIEPVKEEIKEEVKEEPKIVNTKPLPFIKIQEVKTTSKPTTETQGRKGIKLIVNPKRR